MASIADVRKKRIRRRKHEKVNSSQLSQSSTFIYGKDTAASFQTTKRKTVEAKSISTYLSKEMIANPQ